MAQAKKVTDAIFARGVQHLAPTINEIAERHKIFPADLTRGLLEAACEFYDEHGWFSFPVRIEPVAFQSLSVAEVQAKYGEKAAPKPKVPQGSVKRQKQA